MSNRLILFLLLSVFFIFYVFEYIHGPCTKNKFFLIILNIFYLQLYLCLYGLIYSLFLNFPSIYFPLVGVISYIS
jgi:hypothetical protein